MSDIIVIDKGFIPPTSFGFVVTKLAFKKRFPLAKWKAARALAATNADLADFFEDYDLATYIDLRIAYSTVMSLTNDAWPDDVQLTEEEAAFAVAEVVDPKELPGSVRIAYGFTEVPL